MPMAMHVIHLGDKFQVPNLAIPTTLNHLVQVKWLQQFLLLDLHHKVCVILFLRDNHFQEDQCLKKIWELFEMFLVISIKLLRKHHVPKLKS
jgi:hypothetical protein